MNSVRIKSAGARSTPARMCSRSSSRPSPPGRRAFGTATTTGTGTAGTLTRRAISLGVLRVRLLQLGLSPLCRVLRLHPLDGLRVHVDEDVFHERLGGLSARWTGVAGPASVFRRLLEGHQLRVPLPQRVLLPVGRRS